MYLFTHCHDDFFSVKGSEAYVKAIEKVGLVTNEEMKEILSGLEKVSVHCFDLITLYSY